MRTAPPVAHLVPTVWFKTAPTDKLRLYKPLLSALTSDTCLVACGALQAVTALVSQTASGLPPMPWAAGGA